jgi:perosamine synthetase
VRLNEEGDAAVPQLKTMQLIGPLPRLRLFTSRQHYARVFREVVGGHLHEGDAVEELEAAVSARVGVRHAVAMPLARVGIYLAVKALIEPGQKVILSPYTIADVVNMVVCAGGVPVFADISRQTCNIDPAEVERLIDGDTGAVLVTHFHGLACDIEAIQALCRRRGIPVVEDAAQAFGARLGGRPVGAFGDIGIYSFGLFKNVNSFLGGMLVTQRGDVEAKVRAELARLPYQRLAAYLTKVIAALKTDLVTFPPLFRTAFFRLFRYGFLNQVEAINSRLRMDVEPTLKRRVPDEYLCRMTPLQARLILQQLHGVEANIERQIETAELYHRGLADIPELVLPPLRKDGSHTYRQFVFQYPKRRRELVAHALRHGRDVTEAYYWNCADLPCFAEWRRDCPQARAAAVDAICLPTYPRYARSEAEATVRALRRFFGR